MDFKFSNVKKDVYAVVTFALALFVALSLWSYNPLDPSFNSIGGRSSALNYCGYFGSFLSDLLFQVFGLTSWVIVFAFLMLAWNHIKGSNVAWRSSTWILVAVLLLDVAAILGLYLPQKKFFMEQIFAGGLSGFLLAKVLSTAFNFIGVSILLWSVFVVAMLLLTQAGLKDFMKKIPMQSGFLVAAKQASEKLRLILTNLKAPRGMVIEKTGAREGLKKQEIKIWSGLKKGAEENKFNEVEIVENSALAKEKHLEMSAVQNLEDELFSDTEETYEESTGAQKLVIDKIREPKRILKTKVTRVENWQLPKLSLLNDPPTARIKIDEKEIRRKSELLVEKLAQFDVRGRVEAVRPGPAVTMFEFKPNADVKISKITELSNDLALAMSSESLRIIAPIPGRDVVGIETSNSTRETVYLKDILTDESFWQDNKTLPVVIGKQANGEPKVVDLRRLPHMMVAGTTGSGKSVFIVSLITGFLFKHSPKTLRLILIDPKQVDLVAFHKVPHLLMPPVLDSRKAVSALKYAVSEMEKRYRSMSRFGARTLEDFNEKVSKLNSVQLHNHEQANQELEQANKKHECFFYTPQPYMVIVIEEFGDLMSVDKLNVEQSVLRLAQMARACGIHLIIAMQSPRREVITGRIKTNIPGRISFKVNNSLDSRVILDENGAEKLLSQGDMLFLSPSVGRPERHHGAWLSEAEITAVTKHWSDQGEADYDARAVKFLEKAGGADDLAFMGTGEGEGLDPDQEEGYDNFLAFVATQKTVSASLLQRKFSIGYPRAARLIEIFEKEGVVGPANGSKARHVLVNQSAET